MLYNTVIFGLPAAGVIAWLVIARINKQTVDVPTPAQTPIAPRGSKVSYCSGCGAPVTGGRFCSGCGQPI